MSRLEHTLTASTSDDYIRAIVASIPAHGATHSEFGDDSQGTFIALVEDKYEEVVTSIIMRANPGKLYAKVLPANSEAAMRVNFHDRQQYDTFIQMVLEEYPGQRW